MAQNWNVILAVVMVLLSHATARKLLTSEATTIINKNIQESGLVSSEQQKTKTLNAVAPVSSQQQTETLTAASAPGAATDDQKTFIHGGMGGAAGAGGFLVVPILGGLGGYGVLGGYHGMAGGVGGVGGLGGGGIGGGIVKGGMIGAGYIPPHFP